MHSLDVFPKKLTIFALTFLAGIFVALFWMNQEDSKLIASFYQEEVPMLHIHNGVVRLINENQVYARAVGPTPVDLIKVNQVRIISGMDILSRSLMEAGFDLNEKSSVLVFRRQAGKDKLVKLEVLNQLRSDLQDAFAGYVASKQKIFEDHVELNHTIFVIGFISTLLFFILMGYIYHLYRKNLTNLTEVSASLEEQRMSSVNASKLASLGQMAAGLAHEINNPLAVIMARSDMVMTQIETGECTDEDVKKTLVKINDMAHRISKIVTSMRKVSRSTGTIERHRVKLSEVLEDVLNLCHQSIKNSDIELDKEGFDSSDDVVEGDFNQISQIVINLLNNAMDELRKKPADRKISLKLLDDGTNKLLKVIDNAGTIPPEIKAKMFQPFFTSKEVGKGTGLGLSISSSFAKNMGGDLYLEESVVTTFVLSLPKASPVNAT